MVRMAAGRPARFGDRAMTCHADVTRLPFAIWPRISPPGNWAVWTLAYLLAEHVERFGSRDDLKVTWHTRERMTVSIIEFGLWI
jgi:hypothetical protein